MGSLVIELSSILARKQANRSFTLTFTYWVGEPLVGHPVRIGTMPSALIKLPSDISSVSLTGPNDSYVRAIERAFPEVVTTVRGNEISLKGPADSVAKVERLVENFLAVVRAGQPLSDDAVRRSISMILGDGNETPAEVLTLNILSSRGKTIRPKTVNQKRYVDAIDKNTFTYWVGEPLVGHPVRIGTMPSALIKLPSDISSVS